MLKPRKGTTLGGQRAHTMSKPWSWEADYSVVAMCMSETNLSRILLCQAAANKGWKIQIKLLHQMVLELQSRLQRVPALEQDDSRELCHRLRIRNYVFFFLRITFSIILYSNLTIFEFTYRVQDLLVLSIIILYMMGLNIKDQLLVM